MQKDETRIDEPRIERDAKRRITSISVAFGPHHFFELGLHDDRVQFAIGATHQGIRADAAEVSSGLEQMTEQLRQSHPDQAF